MDQALIPISTILKFPAQSRLLKISFWTCDISMMAPMVLLVCRSWGLTKPLKKRLKKWNCHLNFFPFCINIEIVKVYKKWVFVYFIRKNDNKYTYLQVHLLFSIILFNYNVLLNSFINILKFVLKKWKNQANRSLSVIFKWFFIFLSSFKCVSK